MEWFALASLPSFLRVRAWDFLIWDSQMLFTYYIVKPEISM